MRLSGRASEIQPFHVMELLRRARELEAQGRDIVHMELGEPDFNTPAPIVAAGIKALQEGRTRYTNALGLAPLREAIAGFYRERYGVDIVPQQVVVTPGSSGALQLAMALLIDVGEGVLMPDPGYPCNPNILRAVGGVPQWLLLDAASGFQFKAEQLEAAWCANTRALLLASPANPTGAVLSAETMQAAIEWVAAKDGAIIADEIYHGLTYELPAPSMLQYSKDAFVVNSFSKYFGMTGWRVGWLVAPLDAVPALERLAQNLFISAPTPAQYAALAAFKPETIEILERRRAEFAQRRDFVYQALCDLGFEVPLKPQGAFYLYARCSRFCDDAMVFCRRLLDEHGLAITPGIDFSAQQPEQWLRFSFTTAMPRLEEGMARLARALERSGLGGSV